MLHRLGSRAPEYHRYDGGHIQVRSQLRHDNGQKVVLGNVIPAGGGQQDGETVLAILANHPGTARCVAGRICRWFYGEDASQSLINSVAAMYTATGGGIKPMIRAARAQRAPYGAAPRLKRPFHQFVSAFRVLPATISSVAGLRYYLNISGHEPFMACPQRIPGHARVLVRRDAAAVELRRFAARRTDRRSRRGLCVPSRPHHRRARWSTGSTTICSRAEMPAADKDASASTCSRILPTSASSAKQSVSQSRLPGFSGTSTLWARIMPKGSNAGASGLRGVRRTLAPPVHGSVRRRRRDRRGDPGLAAAGRHSPGTIAPRNATWCCRSSCEGPRTDSRSVRPTAIVTTTPTALPRRSRARTVEVQTARSISTGISALRRRSRLLMPAYQNGHLLIVHAAGSTDPTRSHFDAQHFMEVGRADDISLGTGWLGRHLASIAPCSRVLLRRGGDLADGLQLTLLACCERSPIPRSHGFGLSGNAQTTDIRIAAIRDMYMAAANPLRTSGINTLSTVTLLVSSTNFAGYVPAGGVQYPSGDFGNSLKATAAPVRAQVGVEAVAIDSVGWDTHAGQGTVSGTLSVLMSNLACRAGGVLHGRHRQRRSGRHDRLDFRVRAAARGEQQPGNRSRAWQRNARPGPLHRRRSSAHPVAGPRAGKSLRRNGPRRDHRLPRRARRDCAVPTRERATRNGVSRLFAALSRSHQLLTELCMIRIWNNRASGDNGDTAFRRTGACAGKSVQQRRPTGHRGAVHRAGYQQRRLAVSGSFWSELQDDTVFSSNAVCAVSAAHSLNDAGAYRLAEDFAVSGEFGWRVDYASFYVYQPGWSQSAPPFAGVNVRIWSGVPGEAGSQIVWGDAATNRFVARHGDQLLPRIPYHHASVPTRAQHLAPGVAGYRRSRWVSCFPPASTGSTGRSPTSPERRGPQPVPAVCRPRGRVGANSRQRRRRSAESGTA